MNNIFISICIPAYQKPEQLKRLLESISIQTYKNYEVIISDDSKTDDVKNISALFSSRLPIRYFKNNPPSGMGKNWNNSMIHSRGEWIKIMHDDDWFANENSLQLFAETAASSNKTFIFSAATIVSTPGNTTRPQRLKNPDSSMLHKDLLSLLYFNTIGHPSVTMYRKDDAVLFDEQFRWVIDIDFYIRYLQQTGTGFFYLDQPLVNITNDDNQVSSSAYKNPVVEIPEYLQLLSKFENKLHLHNEFAFYCVWELIRKFKIAEAAELNHYGYEGALPEKLTTIINYQHKIPNIILKQPQLNKWLMQYYFKKINHYVTT